LPSLSGESSEKVRILWLLAEVQFRLPITISSSSLPISQGIV